MRRLEELEDDLEKKLAETYTLMDPESLEYKEEAKQDAQRTAMLQKKREQEKLRIAAEQEQVAARVKQRNQDIKTIGKIMTTVNELSNDLKVEVNAAVCTREVEEAVLCMPGRDTRRIDTDSDCQYIRVTYIYNLMTISSDIEFKKSIY